jgi:hypothetical protein
MELAIIAIVALGVLIFAVFLVLRLGGARRAEQVEHDPEREHAGDALEDPLDPQTPLPGWRPPPPP